MSSPVGIFCTARATRPASVRWRLRLQALGLVPVIFGCPFVVARATSEYHSHYS